MTDRLLIAFLLAVLVESAHWVKIRWDFDDDGRARAWQLTSIAIIIAGVLIFLDGVPYVALPNLLTWLPLLLVPMQFVQSFGFAPSMPLNTFSFLAKTRRRRNLRLGLTESVVFINFGNVYFVACLIAATLGTNANSEALSMIYLPGVVVLTGWILFAASGSRSVALVIALVARGLDFVRGSKRIWRNCKSALGRGGGVRPTDFDPNSVSTMIGKPGTVFAIARHRLAHEARSGTPATKLLRIASYDLYLPRKMVQPTAAPDFVSRTWKHFR